MTDTKDTSSLTPPTPPVKEIEDVSMDLPHPELVFTKRELVIIFNVIVQGQYTLGNARVIIPLVDRIEPIVAASKSQDMKPKEVHV